MPEADTPHADEPSAEVWEPTRFQIGEPWPWEPEWVADRGFSWLPDTGILLLVEDHVTDQMCEDMAGPADLAVVGAGPLVGILARFGDNWDWAESLVWRRPGQGIPSRLTADPGEDNNHTLFMPVLVDNQTKIIRHMRAFTASAHFTKVLQREVAQRWATGTTREEADAAFDQYAQRYPTMKAALKGSFARCHAGD